MNAFLHSPYVPHPPPPAPPHLPHTPLPNYPHPNSSLRRLDQCSVPQVRQRTPLTFLMHQTAHAQWHWRGSPDTRLDLSVPRIISLAALREARPIIASVFVFLLSQPPPLLSFSSARAGPPLLAQGSQIPRDLLGHVSAAVGQRWRRKNVTATLGSGSCSRFFVTHERNLSSGCPARIHGMPMPKPKTLIIFRV